MKKLKNKFILLGIVSLCISGCSFSDLMFWKKKNNNPEEQQKEDKDDKEPNPEHQHKFGTLIDEVPASCVEDGMKAHYYCQECGKYFNEDKQEVSQDSLVIEKLGHLPGSTWYEEGGYHYHLCERCSHKVDVASHELHEIEGEDPDHTHDGSISHYLCDICHKQFLDSYGLVEVAHVNAAMTGHDAELTYHPEVPATCETEGTKAYYSCSCGELFEDEKGTKSIGNPEKIPALGHIHNGIWKHDETKHWHECARCHEVFDEHTHIVGSEVHQDLTHSWKLCTICNQKVDVQDLVISGCHHDRLMHFDKLQPTLTKPGHIAYYYCCDCLKCYYDAACTEEIPNTEYGALDKRDGRYLSPLTSNFSILNQNLKNYLDAETDQEVIAALKNNMPFNYQVRKTITWEDNLKAPYVVEVSKTRSFDTFESYSCSLNAYTFDGTLTPGDIVYYRVKDASNKYILDDLSFRVRTDYSLRTLTVDGVSNFRDLGGWTAKDGVKVPYGKLYRGGELKVIEASGRSQFLDTLGIKTEIDLRGDNPEQIISDPRLNYQNLPVWMYTSIIPGISITYPNGPTFNFESYSIASIKSIFEILADSNNYPVYYHCSAGADRTGTISYLISGLLGVSYEDLTRDYELTSFSIFGERYRSTPNEDNTWSDCGYYANSDGNWMGWGKMNDVLMAFYGEDDKPLYVAIENYLKEECDISSETIAAVRTNLLGSEVNF